MVYIITLPYTKIHKMNVERKTDELKKTYPKMKLISHIEFGRLWNPQDFSYGNQARLHKEVKDKVLQNFYDFHYAFEKLPNSYKDEIVLSNEFNSVTQKIFDYSKWAGRNKSDERSIQSLSYALYLNFFTIGIDGLINSMPQEFQRYLTNEMKPILALMQSISKYAKTIDPKLNIPYPVLPSRFVEPVIDGTI